jgi:flagellar motor switch/type III secretory pathway protein FliN
MERMSLAFDPRRRGQLRSLLGASLLMASPTLWAQATGATIGDVSFGGRAEVGGQQLRLNGVGLRASAVLKGFAAALYLPQPSHSTEQVLSTPGPKRLRMRMLLDVPIQVFTHAVRKGIRRNVPETQQAALSERIGTFDRILQGIGKVFDGDVIDLDYLPESGLVIRINDKPRGAPIPGEDLYGALMLVFLGDRPVDAKMKAGLLGQRSA